MWPRVTHGRGAAVRGTAKLSPKWPCLALLGAAALVVAGKAANLKEGVAMARESIDSGRAKAKVAALAKATAGE